MKTKKKIFLLLLCFYTTIAVAQNDKSFKTVTVTLNKDTTFDKIIDYLDVKDIFIQSVDKQAGFIQAKVFTKQGKALSAKAGERKTMNFILRTEGNKTKVTLSIYMEQYYFGGNSSTRSYYYEDKGIMTDASVYRNFLNALKKEIDH